MYRLLPIALLAAAAFAQDAADLFNRAPADIDKALRDRITEFYHDHMTGEYRKAEALVAEDTKDFFYDHNKPKYLGFEIVRIEYSDGYTKAKATINVEMRIMMPGFDGKIMKIPTPSTWKVVDGKWYWYVDPAVMNASPFGMMKPGPNTTGDGGIPAIPGSPEQLLEMVKADKSEVTLKPGGSDQVLFANAMPGPVDLKIEGKLLGVDATFDNSQVKPGERATLTIHANGAAQSGSFTVHVVQTGASLPVHVLMKPGPNITGDGGIPATPASPEQPLAMVKADKSEVTLKRGGSDHVSFANAMSGPVDLKIEGKLLGVHATFDNAQVKPGKRATLTIHASRAAKSGSFTVHVVQTGASLPVHVTVK